MSEESAQFDYEFMKSVKAKKELRDEEYGEWHHKR